jgi:hypothetical protein
MIHGPYHIKLSLILDVCDIEEGVQETNIVIRM